MDDLKALTLRIPPALYERVRLAAFRDRLSITKEIAKILDQSLPEEDQP